MTEIEDLPLSQIVTAGNTKEVKQLCEPFVSEPVELKLWMVVRTLTALERWADSRAGKSRDSRI